MTWCPTLMGLDSGTWHMHYPVYEIFKGFSLRFNERQGFQFLCLMACLKLIRGKSRHYVGEFKD
jgi:hypothetical protein